MNSKYKQMYLLIIILFVCSFSISLLWLRMHSARTVISEKYFALSRTEQSFQLFYKTIAVTVVPSESNILSLSRDLIENSNYKYAIKWLQKAKSDESVSLLGEVYIKEGESLKALEVFNRIHESEARTYYLAKTYYVSGDLIRGDEYLKNLSLSNKVCDLALMANSAIINDCRDFYIKNIDLLNILGTKDATRVAKYSYNLANIANYPQLSLAILEKQVKLGVADRDVYFELGNRLFNKGDYRGAKQSYIVAAKKDEYFPQVYEQLLIVAEKTGDTELRNSSVEELGLLKL